MLIKAKPTKKGRAAFLSLDPTDQEIAAFIEFLLAGPRRTAKAAGAHKANKKSTVGKKAAKRKASRS